MAELNEPQRQAVAHVSGPLIVFAGAGSGKTRTITHRVANLLAEGVPAYRILAVTFTNKAAGEMRQRVERIAGADVVRDLWIGTFHSVCARLLRRYHAVVGLSRNYVIYDDSDQKALIARVLKDLGLGEQNFSPKLAASLIGREKRDGMTPAEARRDGRLDAVLLDVFERYQAALLRCDAVDFDDLLAHVMRIAEGDGPEGEHLRTRYSHVLVDEFQDTNLIQYRLVHALSAHTRNLCVVGDDDQSIYRWRGADVRLIRNFRRDFPDATLIKLEQNYRSTSNIVAAALGIIQSASSREPKELWTEADAGEPLRIRAVGDEREEASFVAASIRAELGRGGSAAQIAVFYRVHAQSRALEEALRNLNVPYQIIGGMKFFERAEVKDLLSYLRLIVNPRSDTDLLRVINTPPRGIGDKTVERIVSAAAESNSSAFDGIAPLLARDELGPAVKKKLAAFQQMMLELTRLGAELGPADLARRVLERSGYEDALRADDSAEADARLGNLEELVGALSDYEEEVAAHGEVASLSGYLERVSLIAAPDTLADGELVSLMTVHGAKGLEFDTVFLTGMEESIFPYQGVDQMRGESEEDLDEERRLAYVAVTRARKRLVITHASMRMLFGRTHYLSASRFLDDIPEEVALREGRSARPTTGAGPWRGPASWAAPASRPAPGTRSIERDAPEHADWDGPELVLHPGSNVRHKQFGHGVVQSVEPGRSPIVVARFERVGTKRIKAEFLELE